MTRPDLVHEREHLQSQHILSQIVPMFGDDLYQLTSHGRWILALKLQPQRRLGGWSRSHDRHMTHCLTAAAHLLGVHDLALGQVQVPHLHTGREKIFNYTCVIFYASKIFLTWG